LARRANERAGRRSVLWQRGYYEHVIRNEKALDRIRTYIANNPPQWTDDPENISRAVCAEGGRV
jgi:putative transposase